MDSTRCVGHHKKAHSSSRIGDISLCPFYFRKQALDAGMSARGRKRAFRDRSVYSGKAKSFLSHSSIAATIEWGESAPDVAFCCMRSFCPSADGNGPNSAGSRRNFRAPFDSE